MIFSNKIHSFKVTWVSCFVESERKICIIHVILFAKVSLWPEIPRIDCIMHLICVDESMDVAFNRKNVESAIITNVFACGNWQLHQKPSLSCGNSYRLMHINLFFFFLKLNFECLTFAKQIKWNRTQTFCSFRWIIIFFCFK